MKQHLKKPLIIVLLTSIIIYTQLYSCVETVLAQANLIEEEDKFKIYAGNFYELEIPKNEGPTAKFCFGHLGEITLKFKYISEYESSSVFMNSLNNLDHKGYSLDHIDWSMVGSSDVSSSWVNFSKNALDRNASLDLSLTVFNQNTTVNLYEIKSLEQAFIEVNLTNWQYSPSADGIALNIETYLSSSSEYIRQGPYLNVKNSFYEVTIRNNKRIFTLTFKPHILIKTHYGIEDVYESMFFANYASSAEVESEPADFWISVPYRYDIVQTVFSFVCYCEDLTENGGINWVNLSFIMLSGISTIAIIKKWKGQK